MYHISTHLESISFSLRGIHSTLPCWFEGQLPNHPVKEHLAAPGLAARNKTALLDGGFHINGGTPIAGRLISCNIPIENLDDFGVPPILGKLQMDTTTLRVQPEAIVGMATQLPSQMTVI